MNTDGLLHLFAAEPTLLPQAPDDASGPDVERRRHDAAHSCAYCGGLAQTALIVQVPGEECEGRPVRRWLDLCMPHFTKVRLSA
jgi:hypothetical protein